MISIILVETETSGNIGAVARVMKNFGFDNLILVSPKCNYLDEDSKRRAKHANNILSKAKVFDSIDCLKKYDYRIGTSSKLGTDYNLTRTPITPKELSETLSKLSLENKRENNNSNKISKKNSLKIAIVFGRESSGLLNTELEQMDFLVNIPTSNYSALNLSHAVNVILYELYQHSNSDLKDKKYTPISRKEIDVMLGMIDKILSKQKYSTPTKLETQKKVWKHMLTKSFLTRREAFALMGFFRKLL